MATEHTHILALPHALREQSTLRSNDKRPTSEGEPLGILEVLDAGREHLVHILKVEQVEILVVDFGLY